MEIKLEMGQWVKLSDGGVYEVMPYNSVYVKINGKLYYSDYTPTKTPLAYGNLHVKVLEILKVDTIKNLNVSEGDTLVFIKGYKDFYPEFKGKEFVVKGCNVYCYEVRDSFSLRCDHEFAVVKRHSDSNENTNKDAGIYKTWGDMTPEEKGALLLAWHEGKTIECCDPEVWKESESTWFCDDVIYRVKPNT